MKNYEVSIYVTECQTDTFKINAPDIDEARALAMQEAFDRGYDIDDVIDVVEVDGFDSHESNIEQDQGSCISIFSDKMKNLFLSVETTPGYYPAAGQVINDEVFKEPLIRFGAPTKKDQVEIWRNKPYKKNNAAKEQYTGYRVRYEFEKESCTFKDFSEKDDCVLDFTDAYLFAKSIAYKY